MKLLIMLLAGGAWSFFAAILMFRPDLAHIVPEQYQPAVHIAFGLFLVWMAGNLSWPEIRTAARPWRYGLQILLRNLAVLGLGVALLVFISHELLHGMDPTGQRAMW
jgi:hypothetical protein